MPNGGHAIRTFSAPSLAMGLRANLSIMMFLEFAVWGAWFVVFFPYLDKLGFTGAQAGALIGNMALGAIFSTLFAGYVADRLVSSEKLMAVCHLGGAVLLYFIAQVQRPDEYWTLFALTLGYALLYNPTLVLVNSITFHHVPDGQRDFPGIRVLGTLGWIAAGFTIDLLFAHGGKTASSSSGPLYLAAGLSAALGLYSFFLPKTPPKGATGGLPFIKALGLFKDFSFAVFFVVSLIITVVLAFYYTVTSDFLEKACGVKNTGSTMLIGQICETIFLPLLPLFLLRMGMKWVLALGMFCWGLRYLLFAYSGAEGFAFALAIAGVALHGFCFDFFFAAGFIHCDNEAPKDIRASAQALFGFLTYGVGMWLGSVICGNLKDAYTSNPAPETLPFLAASSLGFLSSAMAGPLGAALALFPGRAQLTDWQHFWLVPSIGVLGCLAVFVLFFRMHANRAVPREAGELWREPSSKEDAVKAAQSSSLQPPGADITK